jgi:hypothetical protein
MRYIEKLYSSSGELKGYRIIRSVRNFWILLKPLPVGNHQIQFSGSVVDFTATGPSNFVSDAKYDITITMSILLLPDPSLE